MSRWENKTNIREFMEKKGLRKVPGCSLIELDNKIYEFVAGDRTHDRFKEIYKMLDEMGRKLKKAGYVPTTNEVLLDIDEEDKEDALNRHSEKLAIAFALLNSPPKTAIRIVKTFVFVVIVTLLLNSYLKFMNEKLVTLTAHTTSTIAESLIKETHLN